MGKIAFVFAGQGAQYTGMGMSLRDRFEASRAVFDDADAVFAALKASPSASNGVMPEDAAAKETTLTELCRSASKEELSRTLITQPTVFTVDMAAAAALTQRGVKCDMAAGFSLGEIAACAFAGIFPLRQAMELIGLRASLMDGCAASKPGAMGAVLKLSDEKVEQLAEGYDKLWPVNFNSPGQVAVAGEPSQLADFAREVKEAGGRFMPLSVSGAFHCPYMKAATEGLSGYFRLNPPREGAIPVYGNLRALPYENAALEIAAQASNPVRWVDTVKNMTGDGADTFVEVGPGGVLSGLIRRISPSARVFNVSEADDVEKVCENLL